MNILHSLRSKLPTKSKTPQPTTEQIAAPRLIRDPESKATTVVMNYPPEDTTKDMSWFRPKARLAETTIGYMLRNRPAEGLVTFESIGDESDAFLQQLAAVFELKVPATLKMAKSVELQFIDQTTEDDQTMLRAVYVVRLNNDTGMQLVLDLDDESIAITVKDKDAKQLINILSAGHL